MNEHLTRPTWDDTFLAVADCVAARSRCERRQVGAVVVDRLNRVVATGYNNPPAGWPFDGPCREWCPRTETDDPCEGYSDCHSVHAESNALLYADRSRMEGGTLYVTTPVCGGCAKLIANSGIKRVVMREQPGYVLARHVERFLELCEIDVHRFIEHDAAA